MAWNYAHETVTQFLEALGASLILARQDAAELRSAAQPGAAVPTKCLTGAACAGSGRLRSVAVKWEIARLCLSSRD